VQFIQQCYRTDNIKVIGVDTTLLMQALASAHQSRSDKTWGLKDCISFIVHAAENLTDAVTGVAILFSRFSRALMLQKVE
jgi:predicted nucleic acid-binding protein